MNNYEDIINLKHYEPKYHKRMSIEERARIFSPFKSLTGYEDEVSETSRLTQNKIILDEDTKIILDNKIKYLIKHLNDNNKVTITYFIKDNKKNGGSYQTITGIITKIDTIYKNIYINNTIININDIINITSDIFNT